MIRKAKREIEILLDKHNGHGLSRPQIGDKLANLSDDIWLDALCRLINEKKLWFCDKVTRNSKLLLLPSRQIAAAPFQHRLENWKKGRRFLLGRIFRRR